MKSHTFLLAVLALAACGKEEGPAKFDSDLPTDLAPTDQPGDENDDIASAEDVTDEVGFDAPAATGAIDEPGDRDFYAVDVTKGDVYSVLTDSWATYGDGALDTVIRVYGPDEKMLVENDDMPYRYQETDSAVFFEATEDGTYYIEVLEWADWENDPQYEPEGGPTYKYGLWVRPWPVTEVEPNDDKAAADLNEANQLSPYVTDTTLDDYTIFFSGNAAAAGDIDVYPYTFSADSAGATYQWSIWPDSTQGSFKMNMYDDQWNLLATTNSPEWNNNFEYWYDAGIQIKVKGNATYYMTVEETGGDSGTGTFYNGMVIGWIADLSSAELEVNDSIGAANPMVMEESTTTAGFYYGRTAGHMPAADAADYHQLSAGAVGGLSNKYVSVVVSARTLGSNLDPKVKLVDGSGNELSAVSDHPENNSGDPQIRDFYATSNQDIYIVVEAENRGTDMSNQYFLLVYVSDQTVYTP